MERYNMKILILALILFTLSLSAKINKMTILDFDNNSGIRKYNSLGKGLADMLTTDLTYVKGLRIVEREKLRKIMKEMNLSKSKYISRKSALKLGKGLSANWISKGSFTTMKGKIRIDFSIIDTETGEIIESASVEGWVQKFFELEKRLIKKIIRAIHTKENRLIYSPKTQKKEVNFKSVLEYSKAIGLYDDERYKESEKAFKRATEFDNNFTYSDKYLKKLENRLKVYVKNIELYKKYSKVKKISFFLENYDKLIKAEEYKFYSASVDAISALLDMKRFTDLLLLIDKIRGDLPQKNKRIKLINSLVRFLDYEEIFVLKWLKKEDEFIKKAEIFVNKYPNYSANESFIIPWMQKIIDHRKEASKRNEKYEKKKKKIIKMYKSKIKNKLNGLRREKKGVERAIKRLENQNKRNIVGEKKKSNKKEIKKKRENIKVIKENIKKLKLKKNKNPIELPLKSKISLLAVAVRQEQYKEVSILSKNLLQNKENITIKELLRVYINIIDSYENEGKFDMARTFYKSIKQDLVLKSYNDKFIKSKKYIEAVKKLKNYDYDEKIEEIEDKLDDEELSKKLKKELKDKKRMLYSEHRELTLFTKNVLSDYNDIKKYIKRIKKRIEDLPK